jgi:hypothetical protein
VGLAGAVRGRVRKKHATTRNTMGGGRGPQRADEEHDEHQRLKEGEGVAPYPCCVTGRLTAGSA